MDRDLSVRQLETSAVPLKPAALDTLAADSARAAAAAFERAGWCWARSFERTDDYTPDVATLAVKIRRQLDECEPDHSLSSGRISVSRYVEDGVETAEVWLDLGRAHGDDDDD